MSYNYDFDYAAVLLYIIIAISYFRAKHLNNMNTSIFMSLFVFAMITPFMDVLGGEAIVRQLSAPLVHGSNMLYYISEQGTNFCFFLYFISELEMRSKMSKYKQGIMLFPFILTVLVILTNPIHGWVFTYHNNIFVSGWFRYWILYLPMFYYVWAIIYALIKRKQLKGSHVFMIFSIVIINSFARFVQVNYANMLIHCFAVSVSILIIYIYSLKDGKRIDPVTGIANRSYLEEMAKKLYYNKVEFAAILIRISDYDILTTSYGIEKTEGLIHSIAIYLKQKARKNEVFQIDNNYFAIITENTLEADRAVESIDERLNQPWIVGDVEMVCTYFVSCIKIPEHCPDREAFLALLTYYKKMHRMRFGLVPYEELEVKDKVRENLVEKAIERAIAENLFEVYLQPICSVQEQKFVTAEALVRLIDPDIGFISPAEFIPLAEKNGTIISIGNIVLEKVCEFIQFHNLEALGMHSIEVNLSVVQCLQRNFIEFVDSVTSKYNINSSNISFEITETASNCAPAIFSENLEALNKRGFRLALDDFGTGYANLQRLITSPFDIVKFDKEMTQRTCNDESLHHVFEKCQTMFHSMDKLVVAEGVETKEEYEFLKRIGCDYIQGYYFSKPLNMSDFITFMENH